MHIGQKRPLFSAAIEFLGSIGVVCSVRVISGAACLLLFLLSDNASSIGAG